MRVEVVGVSLMMTVAVADDERLFHFPDNCYAERHVASLPEAMQVRSASTALTRDVGVNCDVILSPDEAAVLRVLESHACMLRCQTTPSIPPVPFGEEVPLLDLADALWIARYRSLVLDQYKLRRQRAVALLVKKAKQLQRIAAVADGAGTLASQSPNFLQCDDDGRNGDPSNASLDAISNDSFTSVLSGFTDQKSNGSIPEVAEHGQKEALLQKQYAAAKAVLDAIPSEAAVPQLLPLRSVRRWWGQPPGDDTIPSTNVSVRELPPAAAKSPTNEGGDDAHYMGGGLLCRLMMDVLFLCPNVRRVSFEGHHMDEATLNEVLRRLDPEEAIKKEKKKRHASPSLSLSIDEAEPFHHPSLEAMDLRGNVISSVAAKHLLRILKRNPRLQRVTTDARCMLLPSTKAKIDAACDFNTRCMRSIAAMRSEVTQTTIPPLMLPADVKSALAALQAERIQRASLL